MDLQWILIAMAFEVVEALDAPRSSDAVGCPSFQLARVESRAVRSDAVARCATSSYSAGMSWTGGTSGHVGCTAMVQAAGAWIHTESAAGSTWTAVAFVAMSAGHTCSYADRDPRATRQTRASWTGESGKLGDTVDALSRPSCQASLLQRSRQQVSRGGVVEDVVGRRKDATYLRTCIRLSRLVCCMGSPGSKAGRPESSSARRSLDLAVDRPGRWDGSKCTLRHAMAAVEVRPGDDAVGGRCLEVDDAEDARVVGPGGDNAA